jgi:hypothetical protein
MGERKLLMKGPMDPLAADLASGKIIIEKTNEKKKETKAKVLPEKSRLAVLTKTHEDQVKRHNRAAQEAMALSKHHRSRGEHELANICKDMIEPLQKVATLHNKLAGHYSKRQGESK